MDTSEDFAMHDQSKNQPHELSRVSDERDRSTDNDHKLLDDAPVLALFGPYQNVHPGTWPVLLPALLSCITTGDKRLMTLTFKEAVELLTKEPSIDVALRNAWEEGSFKEVRRLSEFYVAM
jgi:hypothetical protein